MSELFSFRGRTNRAPYWVISLSCLFVVVVIGTAAFFAVYSGGLGNAALALLLLYIPLCWIGLALGARRLHDRNKSAWWLLLFYLAPGILQAAGDRLETPTDWIFYLPSIAISIWCVVELGCLRGTPGPNDYGPDPLQS